MGRFKHLGMALSGVALLSSCSGGGGGGSGGGELPPISGPTPVPPPAPTPPPTSGCSLGERQAWAAAQLNEWYLFPELLATNVNPGSFTTLKDYVDALTAPARALGKDRFYTKVSSIAQDKEFLETGSSAGLGLRLAVDVDARKVLILEAFEGAPGLAAGIDRGTEILAIGTGIANLVTVEAIVTAEGSAGITAALGPNTAGTTRALRVRDANGTIREVTVTKVDFTLPAVSSRYGALIIDDGGKKVGYLNLRSFIDPAESPLRNAFAQFKAQGIGEVIVDLRYNGGGTATAAELMTNLLLGQRTPAEVMNYRVHRPSKANLNFTRFFAPQPQSIASMKIAFIGTSSTASASEAVMNSVLPYLGDKTALIGANTFGKPVGSSFSFDLPQCDDRLSPITFATLNANKQGDYFDGLASKFQATCSAQDDITRQLGDPQEAMIKAALDFLAGRPCASPISGGSGITAQAAGKASTRQLIAPAAPDSAQSEIPGFF
jgi:C-terminal processing protease CtpA/Prc